MTRKSQHVLAIEHHYPKGVSADAGSQDVDKRDENIGAPRNWPVALCTGKGRSLAAHGWAKKLEWVEHIKPSLRAKAEHHFDIMKNSFRHGKAP